MKSFYMTHEFFFMIREIFYMTHEFFFIAHDAILMKKRMDFKICSVCRQPMTFFRKNLS